MTDTPLRERVEKALWETKSLSAFVDAAIALIESETLERAARCAEEAAFQWSFAASSVEVVDVRHTIAAAIRALKEKPNG